MTPNQPRTPDDDEIYFLPYQEEWILDKSPLRIIQKSRQVGITYADAYDSVVKASPRDARLDVWISSRDQAQARLYLEDCKYWAVFLHLYFQDLGVLILDESSNSSAFVLQFANGRRIYCLSSNPNALAGKRGHVKLDEFALHQDQRLLYKVAKPVNTWGGQLSIISTHRGIGTLFNEIINEIIHHGNPKNWSLHTVPLHLAVEQGLVERINRKTGATETSEAFLKRLQSECIDHEQWLQEYCCTPADENSAFFPHDLITSSEDHTLSLMSLEQFLNYARANPKSLFYAGMDVARYLHLCVIDVGEKIGDLMWDRVRIEFHGRPFTEIEAALFPLLALPQLRRACIDSSPIGTQLAERARNRFGWKVEPHPFTQAFKQEIAFGLRRDFEDHRLRIPHDVKLRADLRALRSEITAGVSTRLDGQADDSHCDHTWAKALRQHAARYRPSAGGAVA
jgi:phage FluMu gp28-like protein